ncbi:hypothetical protein EJ03DRAFT_328439, partial [Teratosphaeria nubilosa]
MAGTSLLILVYSPVPTTGDISSTPHPNLESVTPKNHDPPLPPTLRLPPRHVDAGLAGPSKLGWPCVINHGGFTLDGTSDYETQALFPGALRVTDGIRFGAGHGKGVCPWA